jgi:hypothetical protein
MTSVSTLLHSRHCSTKTAMSRLASALFSKALFARQVHGSGTGIGHKQAGQAQAVIVDAVGSVPGDARDRRHGKLHLPLPQVWLALEKQQRIVAVTIVTRRCNGGDPRGFPNSSNNWVSQKFCASCNMI